MKRILVLVLALALFLIPSVVAQDGVNIFANATQFPALGLTINASASSESTPIPLVIDNSFSQTNSFWQTGVANQDPVWLLLTLQSPSVVNKSLIAAYNDAYEPTDFAIQGSNDSVTFVNITRIENNPSQANTTVHFTGGDNYIYYRLYVDRWNGGVSTGGGLALLEWQGFNLTAAPTIPPVTYAACNVETGACNETIQGAIDLASAGDTINILSGSTFSENISIGTNGLILTTNSTTGQPKISTQNGGLTPPTVLISANNVVIDGLDIENLDGTGIEIGAVTNTTIQNNNITGNDIGNGNGALAIYVSGAADGLLIDGNDIDSFDLASGFGVSIYDEAGTGNFIITNNNIYSDGGTDYNVGILLNTANVVLIENNTIFANASQFAVGIDNEGSDDVTMKNNIIDVTAWSHSGGRSDVYGIYYSVGSNSLAVGNTITSTSVSPAPNNKLTCPVFFLGDSGHIFVNGSLTSSTGESFCGYAGSAVANQYVIRGTTVDKTGFTNLTFATNRGTQIDYQNFIRFNVTDASGTPINGATVSVSSSNTGFVNDFTLTTDANGLTNIINATEFIANRTSDLYPYSTFNDYFVDSSATLYANYSDTETLNSSGTYSIIMSLANNLPTVPIVTAPSGVGSDDVVVQYSATDADFDAIEYRIFDNDVLIGTTNDTSLSVNLAFGVHVFKVDAFDGLDYSSTNGSVSYEVITTLETTYESSDAAPVAIDVIMTFLVAVVGLAGVVGLAVVAGVGGRQLRKLGFLKPR
jgi:hypothetical protein